jgi:tetratricopeptide (TPR) repeat protein
MGGQQKDKGASDGQAKTGSPAWAVAAALVVTAINGAIAFVGWTSAESIRKQEEGAARKLAAIEKVLERGYVLYSRAAEREFVELVAGSPGLELTGPAAAYARESVREDRDGLALLEKEIADPSRHTTTRRLMEGYLALSEGDCKAAIAHLEKHGRRAPIRNYLLSAAHQRCGDRQKAIELNNEVRNMPATRPSDRIRAKAIHNNGHALMLDDRPDEAIGYFQDALKADPTLYGVYYNLAGAQSALGHHEDAIRSLCRYARSHDAAVVDEVESDPDKLFLGLRKRLGPEWKRKLESRLAGCT